MTVHDVSLVELVPDSQQPRKCVKEPEIQELAASLKTHGQLVPIIVFNDGGKNVIVDGWRRWLAAKQAELPKLRAIVLDRRPSESDLLTVQIVVNCNRADLTLFEKYEAYQRLSRLENLIGSDLAKRLSVSKATVTRIMSIGSLSTEVQELVRDGKISSANAYAIARMTRQDQEMALAALLNGTAGRQELERLAKKKNSDDAPKQSRVCCELPECSVLLRGREPMSLDGMIEIFEKLIRHIRKARKEGYDVATLAQVMRATANKGATPCSNG